MRLEEMLRFKSLFEEQRKKLLYTQELIQELALKLDNNHCHPNANDPLDFNNLASIELESSLRRHLRNRENLSIQNIEEALHRISLGTFGECETCKQEIEILHLQSHPTTLHCLSCKRKSKSIGLKLQLT